MVYNSARWAEVYLTKGNECLPRAYKVILYRHLDYFINAIVLPDIEAI